MNNRMSRPLSKPDQFNTHIEGPKDNVQAACEAILRSVPEWFGIEESLVQYVRDTATLPTFVLHEADRIIGFLTLREHFPQAWEIHCVAVHADARGKGHGKQLLKHVEHWLAERGARFLQVKTIAATSANPHYALTRGFYERQGFTSIEVFPELWAPSNPCLQMLRVIDA
jgi:ribosomal protein S18 acetylase RimI-like enzyme